MKTAFIAAAVATGSLLASPRAFGWGFEEHTELGSTGYKAACKQLAQDLTLDVEPKPPAPDPCLTPKNDTTARWCIACRTFPAALYGQSVAIAGDHVGTPEDLMSPQGQVIAASVANYASLALENVQHFHPAAPRNWRTFHDRALELATKNFPTGPIARDFAQVFYTSAFADHFLQDAFSAGHAGFNRPASGAVASKAFHDIWNQAGRRVRSPTGKCWIQFGDGELKDETEDARAQIDEAEKAAVLDVLAAFVTGKRDPGRETKPILYMPSEITPNPLPGPVWGTRGEITPVKEKTPRVVGIADQTAQAPYAPAPPLASPPSVPSAPVAAPPASPKGRKGPPSYVQGPTVIKDIGQQQERGLEAGCVEKMVPIDGISNPALINGGVDFWAFGAGDSQTKHGGLDVVYNHRLFSFMSLPFFWEGGLGFGYLRREGLDGPAPSALVGMTVPPLYLARGLWRNEIGAQVKGYYFTPSGAPNEFDGYAGPILRSSLEASTVIIRLQAGPTVDFRTGRFGLTAALGLEFSGTRWITGGGSLTDF